MQSSSIYSLFYLVLWKFWRLSPQQKYAHFFQPNGNPTWHFWGLFLSFWMLVTLIWSVFGAKTWAANINTGYQLSVVSVAALVMLEFTYQAGFLLFWGIGLGHFLSAKSTNYKIRSFSIQLAVLAILDTLSLFGGRDLFSGSMGFSILCLVIQVIGFLCINPIRQLLDKSTSYKSSTLLDEHLTK